MEEDEATNSSNIDLLGVDTVVAEADAIADLIEQARCLCHDTSPILGFDVQHAVLHASACVIKYRAGLYFKFDAIQSVIYDF